ncbi:ATP-binding cassette domain-containing protein [Agromyces marinus]|uniref:ATP-binding cassette domain-containing protein n=1 Tax=Agromyces marinus TaxID=1389020 RepID=UPI001F16A133|nr:ATP-binding cassette domain-containing protein [Agromyces marinus]UIP59712.1 putative ABC transporter ATP-binding protein [Agromyces marinus]
MRAVDLAFAHPGAATLYEGLSFEAAGGELIALTGPSGSGKSTLLSILGGWLEPTHGVLETTGVQRLALVPQNPYGVPGRTAVDHVSLPLVARGSTRSDATRIAREYLGLLKLEHAADRPYRMLSGGERQRMLLARALASKPDLLLVDEPTAQLDATAAAEVCDALAGLQHHGVLIFVATHDTRVVTVCSSVVDLLTVAPAAPPAGRIGRKRCGREVA